VTQVPDPKCGLTPENQPDAFQQAIEDAKANGSSALVNIGGAPAVPTYSVNQDYIRDYVDLHRPDYAPLYDGAFTVPVVNIMFEHAYTVALPLVVGGIAENVNGGEGWGQIDNVNDQYIMAAAIDCPNSSPVAPGCNGIPDTFRHDVGLTYTMEHESAHFLGLNHPHDGAVTVGTTNGQWHYYYQMLKWLYDVSASPTTYAGTYDTYETIDQERLMAGHAAEYLKQSEDWLADSYFMDAVTGRSSISSKTRSRLQAAMADRAQATVLFQRGDYLHAMYGMRNAALHAKGVNSKAVTPHLMSLDQAAHDSSAIFRITPQKAYVTSAPVNAEPLWWTTLPPPAPASTSSTAAVPVSAKKGPTANFCHLRY
jgi:hypothetical protein